MARYPKLKDGDRVPRTGIFELDKGMRVHPVKGLKRPKGPKRVKKLRKRGRR
jgi:hypothetical protein